MIGTTQVNSNLNYKTIYGGGVYETPLLGSVSFQKGGNDTFSVTFTYNGKDKEKLTADNFTACYGTLTCTGSGWNAINKGYISGKSYDATTGVLTITCYLHTSSSVQGTHGATGTVNIFRLK